MHPVMPKEIFALYFEEQMAKLRAESNLALDK